MSTFVRVIEERERQRGIQKERERGREGQREEEREIKTKSPILRKKNFFVAKIEKGTGRSGALA